jgi:glutamate-ammonia-ligase adenylyltransferase
VAAQLSDVAAVVLDRALGIASTHLVRSASRAGTPARVAVIALGPLGRRELSYDADVDVLYAFDGQAVDESSSSFVEQLRTELTNALDGSDEHERTYSVTGQACQADEWDNAVRTSSAIAERLALIDARAVAGDPDLGRRVVSNLRRIVFSAEADRVAIAGLLREADRVEHLVQLLQLAHGAGALLPQPGTLPALDALASADVLAESERRELTQSYIFLRTVEHRLQLVHENQTGLGSADDLHKQVSAHRRRVNEIGRTLAARAAP